MELNRTYNCDCSEGINGLDDNSIALVVTSPPYAMQRKHQYGGVPEKDYPMWLADWMELLKPKLKENGSVCINIRPHIKNGEISDYVLKTRLLLRERGWKECEELIWVKTTSPPISNPMSFWTEQDVLKYIKENNLPIASVYGEVISGDEDGNEYDSTLFGDCTYRTTGCNRTGCIFCAFGCHLEKEPSRFQRLKETHPRQYEYCIGGGEYVDGVWQPNQQGLGMGHVFDELNKIYGDGFIKY